MPFLINELIKNITLMQRGQPKLPSPHNDAFLGVVLTTRGVVYTNEKRKAFFTLHHLYVHCVCLLIFELFYPMPSTLRVIL